MRARWTSVALILSSFAWAFAAVPPPDTMNYQGVLRDAAGNPLDGNFDMIFLFFDSASAGNEILLDQHLASGSGAVSVSGGLFNVALGSGSVVDGSGPGYYSTLSDVFRNYGALWLEIEVAGDRLSPRVKVLNAGYAHNAGSLEGRPAAEFIDTSTSSQTKNGNLTLDGGSGTGLIARGAYRGGSFEDSNSSGYVYLANGDYGLRAYGATAGGYFQNTAQSGLARIAVGDEGIRAFGNDAGGFFQDRDQSGYARVGVGDEGIQAYGNSAGGFFADGDSSGYAWVGIGDDGIRGHGNRAGGYFTDLDGSGYAYIAIGERGLNAFGNDVGGYLKDRNNSGRSWVGFGDRGIEAIGDEMGGAFKDGDGTGIAYVGVGDEGIRGYGTTAGGYFEDSDSSGYGWIGRFNTGAEFYANDAGVYSSDLTSGVFARLAFDGSSTQGNGTKNFVQNHPEDDDRVIVYSALEGDEAATYTRGSARLIDGMAVVPLGRTFRFVTNPDIGLTAHLTPRAPSGGLYVDSLTTEELVVRTTDGSKSDIVFDYIVYGLRIGFENQPVVQVKTFDAYLPKLLETAETAADHPDIAASTPRTRFASMVGASANGASSEISSRAAELLAAIGTFDPLRNPAPAPLRAKNDLSERGVTDPSPSSVPEDMPLVGEDAPRNERVVSADATENASETSGPETDDETLFPTWTLLPVSEGTTAGDLLVIHDDGFVEPARLAADHRVVGTAAAEPFESEGVLVVPVATSDIVEMKVDASFGEIRPGDLLSSSTTPGHAMRAYGEVPGTIVAKALSPVESGRSTIRVLMIFR